MKMKCLCVYISIIFLDYIYTPMGMDPYGVSS